MPIPLPADDAALATRVLADLHAHVGQARRQAEERTRRYEEERMRPTPSNRMLWFVERHFIVVLLLLFFVLLPAFALLAAWFAGPD